MLSRVVLLFLLRMILKPGTTKTEMWSDAGPHFRCYVVLSCIGITVTSEYWMNTQMNVGEPAHLKGLPDGIFGTSERAKMRLRLREVIKTPEDLATALKQHFDDQHMSLPEHTREDHAPTNVIYWFPQPKAEVMNKIKTIKPASLPAPLSKTHTYSFTIRDYRRKTHFGRGHNKFSAENLWCKALILPGMAGTAELTTHPEILPLMEAAGADDGDEKDEGVAMEEAILSQHTMEHLGWRTSYRKTSKEDELTDPSKLLPKLALRFKNLPALQAKLGDGRRHTISNSKRSEAQLRQRASARNLQARAKRKIKGHSGRKVIAKAVASP